MSSEQDVLPGHTLSAFGPEEYAVAQREFSAEHLQATAAAAETMPKAAADKLLELALWDIRTGAFNYLSPGYEA